MTGMDRHVANHPPPYHGNSLPSQADAERKRSIIEYVISTRRQIVKLLVLLRWSKDNAKETERCINLIAFLQRQNYQLERAVNDLKGVREVLNGARYAMLLGAACAVAPSPLTCLAGTGSGITT